ncbi:MAG: DnaA regulatory inactivator Hda, partial [Gammaproteobacteria bacterium]
FPGSNREAVAALQLAAAGTGEPLVCIAGNAGLGKTHLLQASCHCGAENQRSAGYLPMGELAGLSPAVLAGLENLDLLCVDDVQAIAGNAAWERGVFALFNRVREGAATLVIAGSRRPDRIGFTLPDLASRLGWGVTYVLKPMADDEVLRALVYRAAARGLVLPEETASFLLKRIPRDTSSVFGLLDRLDEASMIEQRRLTIPFVKSVLSAD